MKVLGIDPGLVNMGWGVIAVDGSRVTHIANGIVRSGADSLAARLEAAQGGTLEEGGGAASFNALVRSWLVDLGAAPGGWVPGIRKPMPPPG